MSFVSAATYNFRNLKNSELKIDEKNIFLVGENGQGKTNFMEAVYMLCFGNSFRTRFDTLLVREGEEEMSIRGTFYTHERDSNTVSVAVRDNKKEINFNGKKIRDRKEIIHNIPCIVYSHDDIYFVNGSPDKRRLFFNQTISLFDYSFLDKLRRYEKIIKNRNILLKENRPSLLPVYDIQLAEEGIEIIKTRHSVTEEFNKTFSTVFSKVSGMEKSIRIEYRPAWDISKTIDKLVAEIEKKREAELSIGSTITGPHRDRFIFYMDKKDFTKMASTGQMRLISLSLKTAQAEFYKAKTGKKPLVLVDDVLLELDKSRKTRFLESFPDYEQAFFTFLPGEEWIVKNMEGILYSVENGVISQK